MFAVDDYAMSDRGIENYVSQGRFVVADTGRQSTEPPSDLYGAKRSSQPKCESNVRETNGSALVSRMFGVANGVQGLPAGDRASEIVVETARHFVTTHLHNRNEARAESLSCAITAVPGKCAQALSDEVEKNPWARGLGSTLTLAHVVWPRMYLIHVGDCRCYLSRESKMECLTADQTVDGTLAARGVIADESKRALRRRTLWSFIDDNETNVNAQSSEIDLKVGDTLVLCTKGLFHQVPDHRIAELLDSDPPAKVACQRLVAAAHESGGTDDVTVVVVRFRETHSINERAIQKSSEVATAKINNPV